jgi:hypothetical protein
VIIAGVEAAHAFNRHPLDRAAIERRVNRLFAE